VDKITILRATPRQAIPRSLEEIKGDSNYLGVDSLPKCEARRSGSYCREWEDRHPDKTCARKARYIIKGINLCSLHAGEIAVSMLLQEQEDSSGKD